MSLNDICYEHIKDSFYYGLFGDFKLVIDKNTGCFNATKLCRTGGKEYKEWSKINKSIEYIKYLEEIYNNFGGEDIPHQNILYKIDSRGTNKLDLLISGTYVSKDLILSISSWISNEFAYKCNNIIINYYNKEFKYMSNQEIDKKIKIIEDNYKNKVEEKEIEISDLNIKLNNIIEQNNKILDTNKKLESQNKELLMLARKQNIKLDDIENELEDTNYKLDIITETVENILPDRNISPSDDKLKHNLAIYKNKDDIRIIRAQNKISANKLKNIDINDIIVNEYVPNPIDFINRMKLKCNSVNKEIKKKLKISKLKIMNYDELYDDSKLFEIKYSHILLNNSNTHDIKKLFDELKEEQYNY
ncbi:N1R/p28-like protein [Mythimna separata entomopoxvirus 'L']|uniref:N1R/p28-like protein n=1 Tax=Mythimna separata entomopoxvirus 'L' TaxID=1293572 RepID=A0A916KQH0_9POXV|nr:N1R/p28-like protein [Mythimna separata entomopoxvirus 'L']CCU56434.1 N1R/p28-like protein [Mythimna separata entomopoxvirus 'L']